MAARMAGQVAEWRGGKLGQDFPFPCHTLQADAAQQCAQAAWARHNTGVAQHGRGADNIFAVLTLQRWLEVAALASSSSTRTAQLKVPPSPVM